MHIVSKLVVVIPLTSVAGIIPNIIANFVRIIGIYKDIVGNLRNERDGVVWVVNCGYFCGVK